MKKFLYFIALSALISLLIILNPREQEVVSAYQESESHLLLPQRNVVIVTLDLKDNNLDIKSSDSIKKLNTLSNNFQSIKGVNKVDSILSASVISPALDEDGYETIEVKKFIPRNATDEELALALNRLGSFPELKPYINSNADSLLFYISLGYRVQPSSILESLNNVKDTSDISFSFTGKSPIIAVTEKLLSNDILIFLPLLFIFVMLIFLTFRSAKAIFFAWIVMILAVTFSFSFITYIGIKITPLILLVPVFALGLLSDYIIHYMYHLLYAPHNDSALKVRKSLLYPLGLTALSTLTGFLSLMYINASGHTLLGGIISTAVLVTFIGVTLWLPYIKFNKPKKDLLPRFSHYQIIFFTKLYRKRKFLYITLIIGIIWGIITLPNLKIEPYPIEQLPVDSPIQGAEKEINNDFFGSLPFFIEIDSGEANGFLSKESLITLEEIHKSLSISEEVGYSYSLLTVLKRINYYFNGDEESLMTYDDEFGFYQMLIEQYLIYFSSSVDPLEYESLVDPSFRFFSIKGFIKYTNVESLDSFYAEIENIRNMLPENWDLSVHGVVKDLNKEKQGLKKNWIFSFAVGSFLIFITVLLFYRKFKLALLSLIPGFISMVLSFGIISTMGIAIDSFSIIFVAIITGLVIDYSIHTLSALDKMPKVETIKEGFSYINHYSGIPIFLSFLTSLFSFSVLFLSSFKGARSLGLLLFASLLISYILSFYLLPIIILPTKIIKRTNK